MHEFIHHPDQAIVIQGAIFPIDFWQMVEPGYALPAGYLGRLFTSGKAHHLIREGNGHQDQADLSDATLVGYIARKSEYEQAFAAYQEGAVIENVGGEIVISGPPELSVDRGEIANDGVDSVTVTCDLGDPEASDEIRWSVSAPDDSVNEAEADAINGVDSWQLTTSFEGVHTVRVETDRFGWAEIRFEGR
jgi:hypothetical protein